MGNDWVFKTMWASPLVILAIMLFVYSFIILPKKRECDAVGGVLIETGYGPSCVTNSSVLIAPGIPR